MLILITGVLHAINEVFNYKIGTLFDKKVLFFWYILKSGLKVAKSGLLRAYMTFFFGKFDGGFVTIIKLKSNSAYRFSILLKGVG